MGTTFSKKVEVGAYSGYRANERPLFFILGDQRIDVRDVISRKRELERDLFEILADDGKVYLLSWHRTLDLWFLEKTRRG